MADNPPAVPQTQSRRFTSYQKQASQILRDVQKAFPILDGTASDKLKQLIQNSKKLSIDLIEKRQKLLDIAIQKAQEEEAKQK